MVRNSHWNVHVTHREVTSVSDGFLRNSTRFSYRVEIFTFVQCKFSLRVVCTEMYNYRPQGKVILSQASVSHSVHYQPHGYSVTSHPCHGVVDMHPTGMLTYLKIEMLYSIVTTYI